MGGAKDAISEKLTSNNSLHVVKPDLELMVQINYMIEVDFVMGRVHENIRDGLKTIVYHGLRYTQDQLRVMNTVFFPASAVCLVASCSKVNEHCIQLPIVHLY